MKNSAGVWIDQKNAKVAYLDEAKKTVAKYSIEADDAGKTVAAKRAKASYTPNDFVAEDRLERKQAALRKKLYDQVRRSWSFRNVCGAKSCGRSSSRRSRPTS